MVRKHLGYIGAFHTVPYHGAHRAVPRPRQSQGSFVIPDTEVQVYKAPRGQRVKVGRVKNQ